MRQLNFDLLRLLEVDRQGSHGTRRIVFLCPQPDCQTSSLNSHRRIRRAPFSDAYRDAVVEERRPPTQDFPQRSPGPAPGMTPP